MTDHRVRWFVVVDGERLPRQATMRGTWGYDATCSCGWDSRTGGGTERHVRELVANHRWDTSHPSERQV